MRALSLLIVAFVCGAGAAETAEAAPARQPAKARPYGAEKGTFRACTGKKCHREAVFQGHNAARATLRTDPLDKPSGHIVIKAENLGEELDVQIYKPDGSFDEASLARLDDLFRCVRTGEVRAVRAELYEQLSRIYDHFGKEVVLVSGFRFAERDGSRHFHASAMDIRVTDTSYRDVYAFAQTLDLGHMGIGQYPSSQFVHIDFRAPGEPSYRWTDYSGHGGGGGRKPARKATGHTQPARKPVS